MVTMKAKWMNFEVSSKMVEYVQGFPHGQDKLWHIKHRVTIKDLTDNKKISFKFYGSAHDAENGKEELDEGGLLHALDSFIQDCICGTYSFEDFCSDLGYDLGYDADSRTAEKIWKACVKSLNSASHIGIEESNVYDLSNALRDHLDNL